MLGAKNCNEKESDELLHDDVALLVRTSTQQGAMGPNASSFAAKMSQRKNQQQLNLLQHVLIS